jgi:hypothetical protein
VECGEKAISKRRAIEPWTAIIPRQERPECGGARRESGASAGKGIPAGFEAFKTS